MAEKQKTKAESRKAETNEKEKVILEIEDAYIGKEMDGRDVLYHGVPLKNGGGVSYEPIANFIPKVTEIVIKDDGFTQREYIKVLPYHNGKCDRSVSLEKRTLRGNTPDVPFSSGCFIYPGRGFVSAFSLCILEQCARIKEPKHVYERTGWIRDNGKLIYLNGEKSVCETGLTDNYNVELPPGLDRMKFYNTHSNYNDSFHTVWNGMKETAPDTVWMPCYAYMFLTPLNFILREMGEEPSFILYIIGNTGAYKTSIVKVLLNMFGLYNYADPPQTSFDDSLNTIRQKLGTCADTVVLLDDRRPTTTGADKIKYETVEKEISSAIGDRTGRGRLNPDGTYQTITIPRANLIITAEEAYLNVGASAIARSVAVEIKKTDISFEKLQVLQESPHHFNYTMQEYIRHIIRNYDRIKGEAAGLLKNYRKEAYGSGHARIATAYSQLMYGFTQFLDFLGSFRWISVQEREKSIERAKEVILRIIEKQNDRICEDKPTTLFIESIKEMYETGRICLAPRRSEQFEGEVELNKSLNLVGYIDESYIYLIPQTSYAAVQKFCSEAGIVFPVGKTTLWKMLLAEGKIVPTIAKNGKIRTDRVVQINGRQAKYICLLAKELEETEGGEKHE